MQTSSQDFQRSAALIRAADGLLITAGAGLGVDSGLPDFRGERGLWRAYPALGRARLDFTRIANPAAFERTPELAWGFYGHRLQQYRQTAPGPAFALLQDIAGELEHGCFVFTSNVDGQFQQAGFDSERIVECHGSIHHLQCSQPCSAAIWPADELAPAIDEDNCHWLPALPRCPHCAALARPNILMFGDGQWLEARSHAQYQRLQHWQQQVQRPLIIEIGAGSAVATVRYFSERQNAPLIRINPREAELGSAAGVSLALDATLALEGIVQALAEGPDMDAPAA